MTDPLDRFDVNHQAMPVWAQLLAGVVRRQVLCTCSAPAFQCMRCEALEAYEDAEQAMKEEAEALAKDAATVPECPPGCPICRAATRAEKR
jgi:hypothetical protein